MTKVLIFPGLNDSSPTHWQSLWCERHPDFVRVEQERHSWTNPFPDEWIRCLETYVKNTGPDTVVVAHSLACITIVKWVETTELKIKGAMFVAPADVERFKGSQEIKRFAPIPLKPLPFPSILVASENDPYLELPRARLFAEKWNSVLIDVGPKGHIGEMANLGSWEEGLEILQQLI